METHLNNHTPECGYYLFQTKIEDKVYSGGFVGVKDVRNIEVAKMVVLSDITEDIKLMNYYVYTVILISIFCLVSFMLFLYGYVKRIQDRLRKNEKKLIDASNLDALTGIANRRYFYSRSEEILCCHEKDRYVIMVDIDDFKRINDNFGHGVGDVVLKEFAQLTSRLIRKDDLLARIGGEEFVLIFSGYTMESVLVKVENIRNAFSENLIPANGKLIKVTISIGVSRIENEDNKIEHPLKRADKALYKAKTSGKNRIEIIV